MQNQNIQQFSIEPASLEFLRDEIGIKWLPQFDPTMFPFLREEVAPYAMKSRDFRDGRIVVGWGLVLGRKAYRRVFYLMPHDFDPDAMQRRDWICGAVDTASIEVGKPARKATRENYEAAVNLSSGQRKMLASLFAANPPKRRLIGPRRARRKRCRTFPGARVVVFGEVVSGPKRRPDSR